MTKEEKIRLLKLELEYLERTKANSLLMQIKDLNDEQLRDESIQNKENELCTC